MLTRFIFAIYRICIHSICIHNLSKHYSEFVTHNIHPKTSNITEVDIPDNDVNKEKFELKEEDGEENKEEDDNIEVLGKDADGMNDDNGKYMPKKTYEVMTHSC